jgi:glycosyltransferase involved in cell wall biosynthesis
MSCGRPVVGSRSGGIPEIIEDGVTGRFAEVGDQTGFAKATLDLIDDRDRWERMSRQAREAAQQRFSIKAHVSRIVEIYGELTKTA